MEVEGTGKRSRTSGWMRGGFRAGGARNFGNGPGTRGEGTSFLTARFSTLLHPFHFFVEPFAANEFLEDEERDVEDTASNAVVRRSTEAHDQRPATCLTKRRGHPNHA